MGMGTPAQQRLAKTFFNPFFNWEDDDKLREFLRQQDPNQLEQFLNWFEFSSRRDRETIGRRELAKLRARPAQDAIAPKQEVVSLKPGLWGMSIDLKELTRRAINWGRGQKR